MEYSESCWHGRILRCKGCWWPSSSLQCYGFALTFTVVYGVNSIPLSQLWKLRLTRYNFFPRVTEFVQRLCPSSPPPRFPTLLLTEYQPPALGDAACSAPEPESDSGDTDVVLEGEESRLQEGKRHSFPIFGLGFWPSEIGAWEMSWGQGQVTGIWSPRLWAMSFRGWKGLADVLEKPPFIVA